VIHFSRRPRVPEEVLKLNGQDITFVNNVTQLGIIFNGRMTWTLYRERTVAKALRTYLRTYSLFQNERLRTDTKFTLHKTLIRSVITHACPTWEYAADDHPLKL
jgi:hypothetical protein